jgi:hypothetical protein
MTERTQPAAIIPLFDIEKMIAQRAAHPLGMAGVMMENELAAGFRLVQPGHAPFDFAEADWAFGQQVVSLDHDEVRLVIITARHPGHGSFRRLIDAIADAGLKPVVVEPIGATMPAIMARWGWSRSVKGTGFKRVEEWRP